MDLLADAQASIFRAVSSYILVALLLLGLGIGAGGLEKHEDVVGGGSIKPFHWSVEGTRAGVGPRGRGNAISWASLCVGSRLETYEMAGLDAVTPLLWLTKQTLGC